MYSNRGNSLPEMVPWPSGTVRMHWSLLWCRHGVLLPCLAFAVLLGSISAGEIAIESVMYDDPRLEPLSPIVTFDPGRVKPLWLEALSGPEADLRRQAVEVIATAHRLGMPDLADTAESLIQVLDRPDEHPLVRLAAARALIALDARQAAPVLFKHAQSGGLQMAQLVEPVLAEWNYQPARMLWLKRLTGPDESHRRLVLAIEGLGAVREPQARTALEKLVGSRSAPSGVRLVAARALARIKSSRLEETARTLAGDKSPAPLLERLLAATLLSEHSGAPTEAVLRELAQDAEPTVAVIALNRLLEIDPALVVPLSDAALASADARVRRLGAEALFSQPTADALRSLSALLDDPHPGLRGYVRDALFRLAQEPQWDDLIRETAMMVLATDRWRGLEQSALLLGALDHEPAAPRLIELLEFPRREVFTTAAWALRRLAIPDTLPVMLAQAQRQTERRRGGKVARDEIDEQISQLFQAFGQMEYRPAEMLLRSYVPKDYSLGDQSRAAAVWALGYFYNGRPEAELVHELVSRMTDLTPMVPEVGPVRYMAAVSLGRMRAAGAIDALRRMYEDEMPYLTRIGLAQAWAIEKITGEALPPPKRPVERNATWFLEPLDN